MNTGLEVCCLYFFQGIPAPFLLTILPELPSTYILFLKKDGIVTYSYSREFSPQKMNIFEKKKKEKKIWLFLNPFHSLFPPNRKSTSELLRRGCPPALSPSKLSSQHQGVARCNADLEL